MTNLKDSWERIEAIFLQALEKPVDQRQAFLDELLASEPELRSEVEGLLAAHGDEAALTIERLLDPDFRPEATFEGGQELGSYRILSAIGRGGMGEVYRAFDSKLKREVAIKLLPAAFAADPERVQRFTAEAQALAAIRHPGVVTVYSVEALEGHHFLTMELVEGKTLADCISPEGLSQQTFTDLALQLCEALAAVHELGIVHRDLKPTNILVSDEGSLTLIDFGLVKRDMDPLDDQSRAATLLRTRTGLVMGTRPYMSPEQARGEAIDVRSDVFSLGVVLYEMLSGVRPFDRPSDAEVVAAILYDDPPSDLLDATPKFGPVVRRCLEKNPDDRFASASSVLEALGAAAGDGPPAVTGQPLPAKGGLGLSRWLLAGVALVVAGLSFVVLTNWGEGQQRLDWARIEALPTIQRLADENRLREAAELAFEAQEVLGANSELEALWPRITTPFLIDTAPSGATVEIRPYDSSESDWRTLGTTPFQDDRFPVGAFRFRISLDGHETVQYARSLVSKIQRDEIANAGHDYFKDPSYIIDAQLMPAGTAPEGMVRVAGGIYGTVPVIGFQPVFPQEIPEFWIDRYEVTNGQYSEFLDDGGYTSPDYWSETFEKDGAVLAWQEVADLLVDSTGRPGPATFVLGEPETGKDDYPVGGVSWFEADAYCRWRGKSLPTLFHWARAALPSSDSWMPFNQQLARASNFGTDGPEEVGTSSGMGVSGAIDIVGNVREWVSTNSALGRYALGGSWSDPAYRIHDIHPYSNWNREANDGFRCAIFDQPVPEGLFRDVSMPEQTFEAVELSEEAFETQSRLLNYDRSRPLAAAIDSQKLLPWGAKQEWVSIDAVYGERVLLRIHTPSDQTGPFKPILALGGGNIVRALEMEELFPPFDFLVRDGFALVEPVLDGTFQRNQGDTIRQFVGPGHSALLGRWVQDFNRTIDYLETRPDMASDKASFLGLSLGGILAPELVPFEPRIRAIVTYSAGFGVSQSQRSIDSQIGLLQRIEVPVLMLGGKNDFASPPLQQEMMFRFYATDPAKKRQVLYDGGHWPLPISAVLKETTDFLDQHLRDGI